MERRMRQDPELATALGEFRKLNELLKQLGPPPILMKFFWMYTAIGHKLGFGLTRKLLRFVDRKRRNISNMGLFAIGKPRGFSGRNSKFLADCGITVS